MKVLWQQILAFLIVLLTALAISAVRVADYTTERIYSTTEEQLLNYGRSLASHNFSRSDLSQILKAFQQENVDIQIYLRDGRLIYPTYNEWFAVKLTPEQLDTINHGNELSLRNARRFSQEGDVVPLSAVFVPYTSTEFPPGFIGLSAPLAQLNQRIREVTQVVYGAFSVSALLGLAMSVLYAYYQTRKIKKLQQATRKVTLGDYNVDLVIKSQDEFGELAQDFHVMTQSLLKAQEEIKRQENLRRQFMMDAAHEMRTPLTTMSGLVEGLQHDLIPESQRERSLALIGKETQRLIRLVNENLDYEKIRSNQIVLKKQRLSGKALLHQIKDQLHDKAQQKNNNIKITVDDDLVIWGDYDRIVQILMNLVTNAIQFSQDSDIRLMGVMLEQGAQMIVKDNGIGIDATQIESIWERFYKVDVSRKNTKFGESGIGLSVVKSLVEAHQGTIKVESTLGEGTTFTIILPHESEETK